MRAQNILYSVTLLLVASMVLLPVLVTAEEEEEQFIEGRIIETKYFCRVYAEDSWWDFGQYSAVWTTYDTFVYACGSFETGPWTIPEEANELRIWIDTGPYKRGFVSRHYKLFWVTSQGLTKIATTLDEDKWNIIDIPYGTYAFKITVQFEVLGGLWFASQWSLDYIQYKLYNVS